MSSVCEGGVRGRKQRIKTRLQRLEDASQAAQSSQTSPEPANKRVERATSVSLPALKQLPPPSSQTAVLEPWVESQPHSSSPDPSPLATLPRQREQRLPDPMPSQRRRQPPRPRALPPADSNARSRPVSRERKKTSSPPRLAVLITRTLGLGIGLALVVGGLSQLLKFPSSDPPPNGSGSPTPAGVSAAVVPAKPAPTLALLPLTTPLNDLQQRLTLLTDQPGLTTGAVFVDVASGAYVDLNGSDPLPAASVIKLPILVALFQAVDQGRIRLDEQLTLTKESVVGGSGRLQSQPVGTRLSTLSAATMMIIYSDNTATNLLIDRLGGMEGLDQSFQEWGLEQTRLVNRLPDLEGTNTTSPRDMALLLSQLEKGNLVTPRSRDRIRDIMRRTETQPLLSKDLGPDTQIANKTGDIRTVVGDVGIIDLPNGRRYIAAVMVKRTTPNDEKANDLIRQLSKTVYKFWIQPDPAPASTPIPKPS